MFRVFEKRERERERERDLCVCFVVVVLGQLYWLSEMRGVKDEGFCFVFSKRRRFRGEISMFEFLRRERERERERLW